MNPGALDRLVGQTLAHRYRVGDQLGAGGMGTVFRAEHVKVGRPLAIKVLHPRLIANRKYRRRFEREAELAGKLRHPNIAAVVDVGITPEGLHYLVMEYADGPMLSRLIAEGPMAAARVIGLARQLCDGLHHAHDHGLIHRDFKPENVVVERDRYGVETARILDFGIAIAVDDLRSMSERERLTSAGLILGTPHYMAPEHATGAAIDHRIDLFALGVICYEMLAGRLPFDGSGVEVARANLTRSPPAMADRVPSLEVDPLLEAFTRAMMTRARDARLPSAKAARELLDLIERDRPAAAQVLGVATVEPEPVVEPPVETARRRRTLGGEASGRRRTLGGTAPPRSQPPTSPPPMHPVLVEQAPPTPTSPPPVTRALVKQARPTPTSPPVTRPLVEQAPPTPTSPPPVTRALVEQARPTQHVRPLAPPLARMPSTPVGRSSIIEAPRVPRRGVRLAIAAAGLAVFGVLGVLAIMALDLRRRAAVPEVPVLAIGPVVVTRPSPTRATDEPPPPVPTADEPPLPAAAIGAPVPTRSFPAAPLTAGDPLPAPQVAAPAPPMPAETPRAIPDAAALALLYGSTGRDLKRLDQIHGIDATYDLWPRYRMIRINDALLRPALRVQAQALLDGLQAAIAARLQ